MQLVSKVGTKSEVGTDSFLPSDAHSDALPTNVIAINGDQSAQLFSVEDNNEETNEEKGTFKFQGRRYKLYKRGDKGRDQFYHCRFNYQDDEHRKCMETNVFK